MRLRDCFVASLLLAGCDDHIIGEPSEDIVPGVPVYESTWEGVELMFADHCDVCHHVGGSGGFDLHDAILAEMDGEVDEYYVLAGNADGSALWQVLTNSGALSAMPPTGQLEPEQISHVEEWINSGASE